MQDQRVVIQYPKQRERMKNHMMAIAKTKIIPRMMLKSTLVVKA